MICAGIDAGSRTIKIVLIDSDTRNIAAKGLADQGVEQDKLASNLFRKVCREIDIKKNDVAAVVATGYGRNAVNFADTTITEITCHAVGVHYLLSDTMTIIDIGDGHQTQTLHVHSDRDHVRRQ